MAETIGWLIDKLTISELKIAHTQMQIDRQDVDDAHRDQCRKRLEILQNQSRDLRIELSELTHNVLRGKVKLKLYKQFKMYNDPRFMSWSCTPHSKRK